MRPVLNDLTCVFSVSLVDVCLQCYLSLGRSVLIRSTTLWACLLVLTTLWACLQGIPFVLDKQVEVIPTPGHTGSDVSVIVKDTAIGTIVIAGWSMRERHFQLESDIFLIVKLTLL